MERCRRAIPAARFLSTLSLRRATLPGSVSSEILHFLSTLSLRRATYPAASCRPHVAFSIHALLAESDSSYSLLARLARFFYPRSPCGERPSRCAAAYLSWIFYPRSPCGERRNGGDVADALQVFSIHALLAESDSQHEKINSTNYKFSIHALLAESDTNRKQMAVSVIDFLSTLSLRRATNSIAILFGSLIFLSTLSLRRATF